MPHRLDKIEAVNTSQKILSEIWFEKVLEFFLGLIVLSIKINCQLKKLFFFC